MLRNAVLWYAMLLCFLLAACQCHVVFVVRGISWKGACLTALCREPSLAFPVWRSVLTQDGSFTIHGMADLEDVCTSLAFQEVTMK